MAHATIDESAATGVGSPLRARAQPHDSELVQKHRLSTRIWHWSNVVTVFVMLMSGLMIFNAHPRLYWGQYGANYDTAWLEIGNRGGEGFLRVGSLEVPTTGVLGRYTDDEGNAQAHAFPGWATIPSDYSLADARMWHLAFAWALAVPLLFYMLWSLWSGHVARDLRIRARELRPANVWRDVKDHAALRFPTGREALRYNLLQKLSYVGVIFVALPLMIATGLSMSPTFNATAPWLLDLFGGRQSARSIHFLVMVALTAFVVVHLMLVIFAGPWNEVRSMITGRWRVASDGVEA